MFFLAILPQFVSVPAVSVPLQLFLLGSIFVSIALVCDSVWALVASAARTWFGKSPRRVEHLSATGGIAMIGLGGVLALAGAEH